MAMKSGVSGGLRRKIFRRDGYRCQACGLTGWEVYWGGGSFGYLTDLKGVYLSIDHIMPRCLGGSSSEENLQTLCTRCNTLKGTKHPDVWREREVVA